jgi:hypothetical protein
MYEFYDTRGIELEGWISPHNIFGGEVYKSMVRIRQGSMPASAPGKEITIPDGHEIVGCAVETCP